MSIIRCPECGDIITEEDVVARDDKGNFTFKHCGKYWHVTINACRPTEDKYVLRTNVCGLEQVIYGTESLMGILKIKTKRMTSEKFRCPNCNAEIEWVILPGPRYISLQCPPDEEARKEFYEMIDGAVCPRCLARISSALIRASLEGEKLKICDCKCPNCGRTPDCLIIKGRYTKPNDDFVICVKGADIYEDWYDLWMWDAKEIHAYCPRCFAELPLRNAKEIHEFLKQCL